MLARYYEAPLGRFLGVDPANDTDPLSPQSWNKYAYVRNNPIALVDETGKFVGTATGAIVGAVVGGVAALAQGGSPRQVVAAAAGGAVTGAMIGSVVDTGGATLPAVIAAGALGGAAGAATQNLINGTPQSAASLATGAANGAAGVMLGASAGAVLDAAMAPAASTASTGETPASTPVGRSGSQMGVAPGTNAPGEVGGRSYSGHAFNSMQSRGLTPSVVEDAIQTGTRAPGNEPGTSTHYSGTNNVTAVTNAKGRVITAREGKP